MEKLFHNVQRAIKLIRDNRGSYLGQQQPHDNIFKVIVLLLYTLLEGANHTPPVLDEGLDSIPFE